MQPIVLEEVNKLGVNDKDGFDPDILLAEDFENLGILGDENEPLLQSALNDITGAARTTVTKKSAFEQMEEIANSKSFLQLSDQMYINKGEALSKITIKNANR
jgi:hypothetical protein